MSSIVIWSGHPPLDDPWHPFEQTSAAIARTLSARGHEVVVTPVSPAALRALDGVDLVVVNTGGGGPGEPAPALAQWGAGWESFEAWHRTGGAVLGVHTAANSFPGWERWPELLGGRWVRGTSDHPEISVAVFEPAPGASSHPVLAGLTQVQAYDERYRGLDIADDVTPLLRHHTAEEYHVVGWARQSVEGAGRTLYDGLGHDARSYDSPSRAELLVREVEWLLGAR